MTRDYTDIPHKPLYFGEKWDGKNGNYDENRKPINKIILHSTAGGLQASLQRLQNPRSNVSCNYVIDTDGLIHALVPESLVSYHSGNYAINQESVGIEFVDNNDILNSRTESLYNSGARLIRNIAGFYQIPIDAEHIKLHSEIVPTKCPNGLDRDRLMLQARSEVEEQPIQLASDVFVRLVTKSTNYDNLLNALEIPKDVSALADSYKRVLAHIQQFVSLEVERIMAINNNAGVPSETEIAEELSKQPISFWNKPVTQVISGMFRVFKKK